jgi:ribosomal protein L16 Arg81 hydroxylase
LGPHSPETTNLWVGPAGTVTPLHHDVNNVLFMQIDGSKRFSLVPPWDSEFVYCRHGVVADVDLENPDVQKHPLFAAATVESVVLETGDALFIPAGWWHHVRSLTESTSLTFVNFAKSQNTFSMASYLHFLDIEKL